MGNLFLAESLKRAISDGTTEYEMGPGGKGATKSLATSDPGFETIGIARTLWGRAAIRRIKVSHDE